MNPSTLETAIQIAVYRNYRYYQII